MTRLKTSAQVSSVRCPDPRRRRRRRQGVTVRRPVRRSAPAGRSRPGRRRPGPRSAAPARRRGLRLCRAIRSCSRPAVRAARASSAAQSAISGLVRRLGAVPLEHRELGVVQSARARDCARPWASVEDPPLARGQQLLAGELRRGVEIEPPRGRHRADQLGGRRRAGGLVAGRDLQGRGLDLDEALGLEPGPERALVMRVARRPARPPVGVVVGVPPGALAAGAAGHRLDTPWRSRGKAPVPSRASPYGEPAAPGALA